MKRASYREAVEWIALNDSAGDTDAQDAEAMAGLVTVLLVADIFRLDPDRVARDVVRRREKLDKVRDAEAAYDAEIAAEEMNESLPSATGDIGG